MLAVRPPSVAGLFYPSDPAELERLVTRLLGAAPAPRAGPSPKAVIAPHAGYAYSGPVAAAAVSALASRGAASGGAGIGRVVLVGPSHFVAVAGLALAEAEAFDTPLGRVPVDAHLAARAGRLPQVRVRADAHAREHSLEVELPFLQAALGSFRILPLVVGDAAPEEVAEVLDALWGGEETRIVVSSDLSHYLPYAEAVAADRATARAILDLAGPLRPAQACGAGPINGLIAAARRRGLRTELLDLRNSGDTAGGRDQVVGYGAFAFWEDA